MSFFSKLFGGNKPPARDVAALTARWFQTGIRLDVSERTTRSWLGGRPRVPPEFEWPRNNGQPLCFMAQIDLAEVAHAGGIEWLSTEGALVFFFDLAGDPGGYEPEHSAGWRVEHITGTGPELAPPEGIDPACILERRAVEMRLVSLPPIPDQPEVEALQLTTREIDALGELREAAFDHGPEHLMGGIPGPVQHWNMQLECQLVSHGISCAGPSGFDDPRAAALERGASDWRLLLQLDGIDVPIRNGGGLYYWVRAGEAQGGDFRRVWAIRQFT